MKILVIGSDLAVMTILIMLLYNLASIPLHSPGNKAYTTERMPEFSWGGMQGEYVIYLDDSPDFASPVTAMVTGNSFRLGNDLDFGTYYWKVESGPVSSSVWKLTVGSSVMLSRNQQTVKNEGNVDLKVDRMTGFFVLGANESAEIGEDDNVIAEQA
jgi:hypothetical protein